VLNRIRKKSAYIHVYIPINIADFSSASARSPPLGDFFENLTGLRSDFSNASKSVTNRAFFEKLHGIDNGVIEISYATSRRKCVPQTDGKGNPEKGCDSVE